MYYMRLPFNFNFSVSFFDFKYTKLHSRQVRLWYAIYAIFICKDYASVV